jgi:hypothetical protein
MKSFAFGRFALSISAALAFLAACGGSQLPSNTPAVIPQSNASGSHVVRGGSWMLPEAKAGNLLYVASYDTGNVYVFSYPQLKQIGELASVNTHALGECVDLVGDVFITTQSSSEVGTIFEYAPGGSEPIAELSDPGTPQDCSVDTVTGNLAVANVNDPNNPSGQGDVAIYKNAQGSPTMYINPNMLTMYYCGYDTHGNLFVDGRNASEAFAFSELPKQSDLFANISLNETMKSPGAVKWDGNYITIGSRQESPWGPLLVYRLQISGDTGAVVGTTKLASRNNRHEGVYWIQGSKIISTYNKNYTDVGYWLYPMGGKVRRSAKSVGELLAGVAVSVTK